MSSPSYLIYLLRLAAIFSVLVVSVGCGDSSSNSVSSGHTVTEARLSFSDVTVEAGLIGMGHKDAPGLVEAESRKVAGGVAAGDYNGDGYVDSYLIGGSGGSISSWKTLA